MSDGIVVVTERRGRDIVSFVLSTRSASAVRYRADKTAPDFGMKACVVDYLGSLGRAIGWGYIHSVLPDDIGGQDIFTPVREVKGFFDITQGDTNEL